MLHLDLKDALERHFAHALAAAPTLYHDALRVSLHNGVDMEVRYPAGDQYAIAWQWGDATLRIDTAPVHPSLASFPHHLHDATGTLRPDCFTRPGAAPWDNLRTVLEVVLADPLLGFS